MTELPGRDRESYDLLRSMAAGLCVLLAILAGAAAAAQLEHAARWAGGGIDFQYGLMPAEVVARHAKDHPEAKMHGGAPAKGDTHVVVALFDKQSGARIADAEVDATVALLGGASIRKRLEPMAIGGLPSYGGFFSMGAPGLYRIRFEARAPAMSGTAFAEFEHRIGREAASR